mmetsp:Transcript_17429/g.44393  ORF Transcript_17429/g.44393 Transcript_17429/m.44393 type:complete len:206 (-) Transcript_17429:556-1173(-)
MRTCKGSWADPGLVHRPLKLVGRGMPWQGAVTTSSKRVVAATWNRLVHTGRLDGGPLGDTRRTVVCTAALAPCACLHHPKEHVRRQASTALIRRCITRACPDEMCSGGESGWVDKVAFNTDATVHAESKLTSSLVGACMQAVWKSSMSLLSRVHSWHAAKLIIFGCSNSSKETRSLSIATRSPVLNMNSFFPGRCRIPTRKQKKW